MEIFFTSDHHFGNVNVIKYCKRPYTSVEEMDADLIKKWNEVVKDGDLVYYLGDFTLNKKHLHNVKKLNGIKHLIPGNHDLCWPGHKKWLKEDQRYRDAGFKHIFPTPQEVSVGGTAVLMWHLPYATTATAEDYEQRYLDWRLEDKGRILIHGHVHEKWLKRDNMVNVGVDRHDFYPVSEENLFRLIQSDQDYI